MWAPLRGRPCPSPVVGREPGHSPPPRLHRNHFGLILCPSGTWFHCPTSPSSAVRARESREPGLRGPFAVHILASGNCFLVSHFCTQMGIVWPESTRSPPPPPHPPFFFFSQATLSITWLLEATAGRILSHNCKQTI